MVRILKTPAWLVFIQLMAAMSLSTFVIKDNGLATALIHILCWCIYFSYPMSMALVLNDRLPKRVLLNVNFYLINSFIWFAALSTVSILSDGQGITFSGLAAFPMFYVFFASIHILAFPAKTLKSLETGKEAGMGEYLGDFFLILFLPIGIWFLQPRIQQILSPDETSEEG